MDRQEEVAVWAVLKERLHDGLCQIVSGRPSVMRLREFSLQERQSSPPFGVASTQLLHLVLDLAEVRHSPPFGL